jgi:membrane associated rhomboid family serine protease
VRPPIRLSRSSALRPGDLVLYGLLALNIVLFVWCAVETGSTKISGRVLYDFGANYQATLLRGDYWRLIAAGFLHLDPVHLFLNMIALFIFGRPVIERVQPFYFLAIYLIAIASGAVCSIYLHNERFLSAGASGGISGLLGALVFLWLYGKVAVSPQFLLVNLLLSAASSRSLPTVDWQAHFGGFAGGFLSATAMNLIELAAARVLTCKFPEFLKIHGGALVVGAVATGLVPLSKPLSPSSALGMAAMGLGLAAAIKAMDWLLARPRGVVPVVALLAIATGVLVWLVYQTNPMAQAVVCREAAGLAGASVRPILLCNTPGAQQFVMPVLAAGLTLLMYAGLVRRGLADVGFMAATFQAERRRRQSGL